MSTKGELTRSKILANAGQVFQDKGILATTVTDLLNATGTTKGNLYFHFSSKEDIGLEVLKKAHTAFNSFLDKALTGPTPGAGPGALFYRSTGTPTLPKGRTAAVFSAIRP